MEATEPQGLYIFQKKLFNSIFPSFFLANVKTAATTDPENLFTIATYGGPYTFIMLQWNGLCAQEKHLVTG